MCYFRCRINLCTIFGGSRKFVYYFRCHVNLCTTSILGGRDVVIFESPYYSVTEIEYAGMQEWKLSSLRAGWGYFEVMAYTSCFNLHNKPRGP
jgi:hypothetical protein